MSDTVEGLTEPSVATADRQTGFGLSHHELLERTRQQAAERNFQDVFIVDSDFHHIEGDFWTELLPYVDNEVVRDVLTQGGGGKVWLPGSVNTGGMQEVAGRIQPVLARKREERQPGESGGQRDVRLILDAIDSMAANRVVIFPQQLLALGTTSFQAQWEVPMANAYARWVTERMTPDEPRINAMPWLPFSDPEACLKLVEDYGDKPGIVGFMITTTRYQAVHNRRYMPLYAALEERGLPLAFHGGFSMVERTTAPLNKFAAVHGIGFPLYFMVHVTNWILNGLPERFPRLKLFLVEGGVAWIPFLGRRLDHQVMMRPSEAPLLQKLPSEYLRDFFYSSQPLEAAPLKGLKEIFETFDADTQLLWSSDWPHWDWDPPSRIWDLPFLTDESRRNILGGNACRMFGFDPDT